MKLYRVPIHTHGIRRKIVFDIGVPALGSSVPAPASAAREEEPIDLDMNCHAPRLSSKLRVVECNFI
ncbi:hypothetical protein BLNAU_1367 [Blattamonas nauphoetae]|uniref:Uncharacterized protein n=1 Tax=Blattamonas nauphoetae TaxID=2049346 RepID=A0ABQ9YJ66_9EUKA|nr:hypothetical protein BLNAU_1367 [Blattamonas nauphoetae]